MLHRYFAAIAAVMISGFVHTVQAESVLIIENFESYSGGIGSWSAQSEGIDVELSLASTGAIEGNHDLKQTVGVGTLAGAYVVRNLDMNIAVPLSAATFKFKYKPLLAVSLTKQVVITLRDQDNVNHISPPIAMAGLQANQIADYQVDLSNFSPPANAGAITILTGVTLRFTSTLSLAADEHIDFLRFTWENSDVNDWTIY